MRQLDDGADHRHVICAIGHAAHEGLIDFQFVGCQLAQLRQ